MIKRYGKENPESGHRSASLGELPEVGRLPPKKFVYDGSQPKRVGTLLEIDKIETRLKLARHSGINSGGPRACQGLVGQLPDPARLSYLRLVETRQYLIPWPGPEEDTRN